jgi:hypothetical protein
LRDFVISLAPFVKQSRTLHTLTAGPKTGVHFTRGNSQTAWCIIQEF